MQAPFSAGMGLVLFLPVRSSILACTAPNSFYSEEGASDLSWYFCLATKTDEPRCDNDFYCNTTLTCETTADCQGLGLDF